MLLEVDAQGREYAPVRGWTLVAMIIIVLLSSLLLYRIVGCTNEVMNAHTAKKQDTVRKND